jgi:hypothetical protein
MIKINTVIYFSLIFVIISAVYLVENKVQSLRSQINKQVFEIKQFKQDTHVLMAEWSYLNNPERLRKLASQRITVDSPKPVQITDVDIIPMRSVVTASN